MTPSRAVICAALSCACVADDAPPPRQDEDVPFVYAEEPLTPWVNPMLGTAGPGNVIPGALVPHGMVRASPDTRSGGGSIDAYDYGDAELEGFSHTHLEGPGGSNNGYAQILLLPQAGPLDVDPATRGSAMDHDREIARPGKYEITLDDGVRAELSATAHAAVHRYAFPAGPARLILDLGHSNGRSDGGALRLSGDTLEGYGDYIVHPAASLLGSGVSGDQGGTTGHTRVYTSIRVSLPPTERGTFRGQEDPQINPGAVEASGDEIGGWVGWTLDAPTVIEVEVGVSYLSEAAARRNREIEIAGRSLDAVASEADAAWNHLLNRVVVDADDTTRGLFYSLLYHAAFQPAHKTEPGGGPRGAAAVGASGAMVGHDDLDFDYYTDDWCLWDTYRTLHPLGTLFEPEIRDDIARSMIQAYVDGGWLDKCSWSATGYSRVMIGNHFVPVLLDAARLGLTSTDPDLLWEAVDHAGSDEISPLPDGICGYVNLGTPPEYLSLGWVPNECDPTQAASMTMEHAYDDQATAWLATALGRPADAERYQARAGNWRNHWDPAVGFMRGKRRDGSWVEPFDPADMSGFASFVEASPWIFTFFAPHDVPGLASLMGGDEALVAKLDAFFAGGHFDVTNQPSFHIPWLYAHAGAPDKAQERVRATLDAHFRLAPDGLPGNDDAGAMSAWAVLSMLGLYPVAPGDGRYTVGAPRVRRAELRLHPGFYEGGTFTITTDGDPETDRFIAAVTLDGAPLTQPWITDADITSGATLHVSLSATPGAWRPRP
jgi:predicted alpha-1,2-mannosidase